MFRPDELFDLSQTDHAPIFDGCENAWEALKKIRNYIAENLTPGLHHEVVGNVWIGDQVFIGQGTVVEDGVMIKGPAIIGENCEIRHGAYFRENVIVGDNCVVGNSCELKNSLLFNHCQVPHFNYVGDSILGYKSHLGAGVKISNVKLVKGNIILNVNGGSLDTGLRKFGVLLGDHSEVGCNTVINPGSIIGRNSVIYPNVNWRGILSANRIVKNKAAQEIIERATREA